MGAVAAKKMRTRVRRALARAGVRTPEQLAALDPDAMPRVRGFGPGAAALVREALASGDPAAVAALFAWVPPARRAVAR